MEREEALDQIRENIENENLVRHMLAVEAVMRALAGRFGEDADTWGLTGLVHDIDVELTREDSANHSKLGADIVRDMGCSVEVCHAVLCHNPAHGVARESNLDKALFCTDPLTGLITAVALLMPDRKLASVKADSVAKRFKQPRFAAGARREQIAACSELGLELEEFISLALKAMQGVAGDLGM